MREKKAYPQKTRSFGAAHPATVFRILSTLAMLEMSLAQADTYTWTGATDNEMTNAGNWSPATTPLNQDIVIFDGSGTTYSTIATGGSNAFLSGNTSTTAQGLKQITVTSGHTTDLILDGGMRTRAFTLEVQAGAGAVSLNGSNIVGQTGHSSGYVYLINNSANTGTLGSFTKAGTGSSGDRVMNIQGSGDWVLAGNLSGIGTLNKTGTGTLTFSGSANDTSWFNANVSEGALNVTGTLETSAYGTGVSVAAGATLEGTGTINRTTVIDGTLAPGESPGTLTFGGDLTLGADANLNWQMYDAAGGAGVGYDLALLSGGASLDLSELSEANPFNINLWSLSDIGPDVDGDAINFNSAQDYEWMLFQTDSTISGFSESLFNISSFAANGTSGFSNALNGGTFGISLSNDSTDLLLNFTAAAVPEPSDYAAYVGVLIFSLAFLRRRYRRT